jgi:hypothetical protein
VLGVAVRALWIADNFPVLSVVGFLVMLAGAVMAVTSAGSRPVRRQRGERQERYGVERFVGAERMTPHETGRPPPRTAVVGIDATRRRPRPDRPRLITALASR